MSNSSKSPQNNPLRARLTIAVLITLAAGLASAAVGLNPSAVGLPSKDQPAPSKPAQPASLRCWQFGKLLFEETGFTPDPNTTLPPNTALSWSRSLPNPHSLQLLNLGDTTCLYSARRDIGVPGR